MKHAWTLLVGLTLVASCGHKRQAFEPDANLVAEVRALLDGNDAHVLAFVDDVSHDAQRLERMLAGAPQETAALTVRACRLVAAHEGKAMRTGKDQPYRAHSVGKLIGHLGRLLPEPSGAGVRERLQASYAEQFGAILGADKVSFESDDGFAGAVVDMHVELVGQVFWDARDPQGVRERVVDSPELADMRNDYREFRRNLMAGYVSRL